MNTSQQVTGIIVLSVVFLVSAGSLRAEIEKVIIKEDSPQTIERTIVSSDPQTVRTTVTTVSETEVVPESHINIINSDTSDDVDVEIQMESKVFETNENVDGKIIVRNASTESLPATFHVKLFHDEKLFRHMKVETKDRMIPPGVTTYSLEEFGIPDLNKNRNYSGEWVIMIYDDNPANSIEERFRLEHIDV